MNKTSSPNGCLACARDGRAVFASICNRTRASPCLFVRRSLFGRFLETPKSQQFNNLRDSLAHDSNPFARSNFPSAFELLFPPCFGTRRSGGLINPSRILSTGSIVPRDHAQPDGRALAPNFSSEFPWGVKKNVSYPCPPVKKSAVTSD